MHCNSTMVFEWVREFWIMGCKNEDFSDASASYWWLNFINMIIKIKSCFENGPVPMPEVAHWCQSCAWQEMRGWRRNKLLPGISLHLRPGAKRTKTCSRSQCKAHCASSTRVLSTVMWRPADWASPGIRAPAHGLQSHLLVQIPFCKLRRILQTLLTFFSLQVVQDGVDHAHGLVHQGVQLGGARVGDLVLVEQQEIVLGVSPLTDAREARAASAGASLVADRVPWGARPEARLPVGGVEGQEVIYPGLCPVPLRRHGIKLVPVDVGLALAAPGVGLEVSDAPLEVRLPRIKCLRPHTADP